jgi:hypothetical protein
VELGHRKISLLVGEDRRKTFTKAVFVEGGTIRPVPKGW